MQEFASFASSVFGRLTHWLVMRRGIRNLLVGTIALAGIGALAVNQGAIPSPAAIASVLHVGDNDHDGGYWHHHGFDRYGDQDGGAAPNGYGPSQGYVNGSGPSYSYVHGYGPSNSYVNVSGTGN
jgi:hypothetical protein